MSRNDLELLILDVIRCSRGIRELALVEASQQEPGQRKFELNRVLVELIEGWCVEMIERGLPGVELPKETPRDISDPTMLAHIEAVLMARREASERSRPEVRYTGEIRA